MQKIITTIITLALALGLASSVQAKRGSDGQLNLLYWQAPSTMNPNLSGGTKELEVEIKRDKCTIDHEGCEETRNQERTASRKRVKGEST